MESFTLGLMRGDGAPLYRQLYRHIVEEIASGGLAAGEKLPSQAPPGSGPAGERFHRGNGLPNAGGGGAT